MYGQQSPASVKQCWDLGNAQYVQSPETQSATPSGTSSSSVTITAHREVSFMASQKMSLEMISSFFCSSPLSLVLSASPVSPAIGAVATRLDMRLHATEMELMITARSASMCPCCSCRNIHVERVSVPTFSDAGRLEGDEASVALEESLAVALACFSFVGLSLPSAPSVFSTKSTSSGDPRKKGVLWCTLFGVTSRARPNPVDAFPPA